MGAGVIASDASGPRAYVFIRDVMASSPNTGSIVSSSTGDVTPRTPISDPHFVGMFDIFDGGAGQHATYQEQPNFLFDATDAIVRVYGSISKMPRDLMFVIFAVTNRPGVDPGTVSAGSIELVVVTP